MISIKQIKAKLKNTSLSAKVKLVSSFLAIFGFATTLGVAISGLQLVSEKKELKKEYSSLLSEYRDVRVEELFENLKEGKISAKEFESQKKKLDDEFFINAAPDEAKQKYQDISNKATAHFAGSLFSSLIGWGALGGVYFSSKNNYESFETNCKSEDDSQKMLFRFREN